MRPTPATSPPPLRLVFRHSAVAPDPVRVIFPDDEQATDTQAADAASAIATLCANDGNPPILHPRGGSYADRVARTATAYRNRVPKS
jgi:hypothetical protein